MTEEIAFKGGEPSESTPYVPYTPPLVKAIMAAGSSRPPLIEDVAPMLVYYVNDFGFLADLKITDVENTWEKTVPLSMIPYVKPVAEKLFDTEACNEATRINALRSKHNKWVIDLLREFVKRNDLGVSAGQITMPPPPEDAAQARANAIRAMTQDKLQLSKRAIEYLASEGLFCGKDYEFDKAFDKANEVSFVNEVLKRINGTEGKKYRVSVGGRPPTWWDGKSERDESGHGVAWSRGPNHTFMTLDLQIKNSTF